eukprot:4350549-Pyramimonas_sp.AAC.1
MTVFAYALYAAREPAHRAFQIGQSSTPQSCSRQSDALAQEGWPAACDPRKTAPYRSSSGNAQSVALRTATSTAARPAPERGHPSSDAATIAFLHGGAPMKDRAQPS